MDRDEVSAILLVVIDIAGLVVAAYWMGRLAGIQESIRCLDFDGTMGLPRAPRSGSLRPGLEE